MGLDATLLYAKPAGHWCEALPIGNGRIGGMVFGSVRQERIALNEDTLWSGHPQAYHAPEAAAGFRKAQANALARNYRLAQGMLERTTLGMWSQLYLPLGDLLVEMAHGSGETAYRRTLDLSRAIAETAYRTGGVQYRREAFVSHPHQVLVLRFTADQPGSVALRACLENQLRGQTLGIQDTLVLEGRCPDVRDVPLGEHIGAEHLRFNDPACIAYRAALRAVPEGGTVTVEDGVLEVSGADAVTLYLSARTSFTRYDQSPALSDAYRDQALRDLDQAAALPYAQLREAHVADHQRLFQRTSLRLEGILPENRERPTDERLRAHADGATDLGLYQLLFDYGKYLTIAASREGTQPSNLQGIWNHRLLPPWNSNYTVNINTEMNYWPVHGLDLLECEEPLVRMIGELVESGRETAEAWYGARGFVCHHNTDLWRLTTPVGHGTPGAAQYACWPMAGGWLARHLWERYEHTQDLAFLKEHAYPALRESALFYMDLLVEDRDGSLILCPSTSPENSFILPDGTRCPVSASTAMTMAIVREVFDRTRDCQRLLGLESDPLAEKINALRGRLKPYEIGPDGRVLEWSEALTEQDPHHRHLSHLYGLYPGREILPDSALAEACRRSLDARGDEGTGWSLAWKVNFRARLGQGDHALRLIDQQLRPVDPTMQSGMRGGGSYPNLLCAHPPFQIDGNFGAVAGILNMLIQCDGGQLRYLPALPARWPSGTIAGVRVPGKRRVDLSWQDGALASVRVYPAETE